MYYVLLENHLYSYEIYEILSLYFPGEKITVIENIEGLAENSLILRSSACASDNKVSCICSLSRLENGAEVNINNVQAECILDTDHKKSVKHCVKLSAFKLLKKITGTEMPWGILVGIRPTKIINDLKLNHVKTEDIYHIMKNKYLLREDKIKLVTEVSDNSNRFINSDKKSISLYIGIPFCPSRCVYCSFASYPITKYNNYVKEYIECLQYEIEEVGKLINKSFKLDTLYIGGGTPTSLDDDNFKMLLETLVNNCNVDSCNEFTVEAGRPDTITRSKIKTMQISGVDRISINPQSMNDETLVRIGRNHTVKDIIEKYTITREFGFKTINMDMILGLPGEDLKNVEVTLNSIIDLAPENITVHTMAVKRASELKQRIIENESIDFSMNTDVDSMMDLAYNTLHGAGYMPYYMYRQKMTAGNLENVGYCVKGHECLYNIQMIEEKETIIGLGADAVTKMVFHDENRIERLANKKDLKEYISTIKGSVHKKLITLEMLT